MKVDIQYYFSIVFALSKSEWSKPEGEAQFTCKIFYGKDREKERVIHAWAKSSWIERYY